MVKHIMADGRQLESVSGIVIRKEAFPELGCLFTTKKGETHGHQSDVSVVRAGNVVGA